MAEFALGLTKTAVESSVRLVKSAVEEEDQLKEKVQNDLVFISGELEMVQSFLRAANNNRERERARNDQVVLTRVRQLRRLAFDVEDCIEHVLHLDLNSRWAWLWRAWQKLYCCAPALPLDTAIAEIKQLKARVEDVSQRNSRYSLSLTLCGTTTTKPPAEDDATSGGGYASSACFHLLRDAWEATGKWRRNTGNLQQELLVDREEGDDDLQVISVWGSNCNSAADVGMASILANAYCDPKIREAFKICAWVKLAHPFNQQDFFKSLLSQFYAKTTHQAADQVTEDVVGLAMMQQQMGAQRYLLVLEDVFTVAEWDVIRTYLPDSNHKGSRIVVSTPQLRVALLCTGKPYQVSELTQFSRHKFLCAFFKKMPSNMDDFKCQLRHGGVISVWGPHESIGLVNILYKCIINRKKEFDGVQFERHSWVDVPVPFDLDAFARHLWLNFCSDDIRDNEIREVGMKGQRLIKWCCELLSKEECLVVINGLQSMGDWDLIKSKFLSSNPPPKGCILVVTNDEKVATHCVKDPDYQALNIKDLEADTTIVTLKNKEKEPLFYSESGRREKATESTKKVELVGRWTEWNSLHRLVICHPDVTSVWGIAGVGKSFLVRKHYCKLMPRGCFISFGWVDVPHPFNLTELSSRLLLDLHSNDPQAKETAAVSMMEGQDPILECSKFLRGRKCLVVIDGLRSIEDWDLIRATFLSKTITSTIVVITNDANVAMRCVENNERRVLNIRRLNADTALNLLMEKVWMHGDGG